MNVEGARFESSVRGALAELGVSGGLDDRGQVEFKTGSDEVWLRLEVAANPTPLLTRRFEPAGRMLVVRSRIYTFRKPPKPEVLAAIDASGAGDDGVEYLEDTRSLYARTRLVDPPEPSTLLDAIERTCGTAERWLREVLPRMLQNRA